MPRKATPAAQFKETKLNELVVKEGSTAQNELAVLEVQQAERLGELATKLGYEGVLTVGGIEDNIRIHQRMTVEGMLRLGKLLLLLKEATPHGDFESRVDLLGFHIKTAQRFMAAATRVGKNDTVSLLAGQAKNQKAFLELITHDDDVIKELGELDEFDKMSASQLRTAARNLRNDYDDALKQSSKKSDKIVALELKVDKIQIAPTDWPKAFSVLFDQAAGAGKDLGKAITAMKLVAVTASQVQPENTQDEATLDEALRHLAETMLASFNKGLKDLYETAQHFEQILGARAGSVQYP